jgi:8-oxo-dGTP diphosphatase
MNVGAVVWKGAHILFVQQQGRDDPSPGWALPGGRVEAGEFLFEAVTREVYEETGLEVITVGPLVYAIQVRNASSELPGMSFVFEIADWQGAIQVADPEGKVLEAQFFSVEDAIVLLEAGLRRRIMREPIVAFLKGAVAPGAFWYYRADQDGAEEFLMRHKNARSGVMP